MTDYKLVPVEPTPEMLEAGEYAQYTGCYVSGIYADMLAAAPAVQGEPVAWKELAANWLREKAAAQQALNEQYPEHAKCYPTWKNWVLKLNWLADELSAGAAPQPAEQQPLQLPDFVTDPDDSDEVASLWDHGYKRGWNACLETAAKAMQSAEQQPAPDVTQLVEALEDLVSEIERTTCVHENTHRGGVLWEICEDCGGKWADDRGGKPEFAWPESVETARNLIHAHRKQGGK